MDLKITYIFPPLGFKGQKISSMPLAPPVLEYMAGLTVGLRPNWKIELINANREDVDNNIYNSDIVCISVLTHQTNWVYNLSRNLSERRIKVLLGGPHPSVLPNEAKQHCDSVVVGEAESVIEQIFSDIEHSSLKDIYYGDPQPLRSLPFPKRDILKGYIFHSYFTSRGCPYSCSFCTTPILHGRKVRYRPIDEVIKEIADSKHKRWFCSDPDIWGPDTKRYIELFKEMSKSLPSIMWLGEASLSAVQQSNGDKLLYWAKKSGLSQVMVGFESFNEGTCKMYSSKQKLGKNSLEAIKKIRANGIDVILFIMMGHPGEDSNDYEDTLEKCDKLNIAAHPVMVVPYPGTELYKNWKNSLVYEDNWDYYDGLHSVVKDSNGLNSEERERKLIELWLELYTYPRIFKRLINISYKGFPNAHIGSLVNQIALKKAFEKYAKITKFAV